VNGEGDEGSWSLLFCKPWFKRLSTMYVAVDETWLQSTTRPSRARAFIADCGFSFWGFSFWE